jgi:hypothetical protein
VRSKRAATDVRRAFHAVHPKAPSVVVNRAPYGDLPRARIEHQQNPASGQERGGMDVQHEHRAVGTQPDSRVILA